MKIFAHRGLLNLYPENSQRALKEALNNNFSVETDLRLTKDGDFIIIHDDNILRLCGKNMKVSSLFLKDLKQISYLNNQGKPISDKLISFRDYCEFFVTTSPSLVTAVQLKSDSQTEKGLKRVSDYFKEFNLYKKAFIFDLTKEAASKIRKIDKNIKIALIVSDYKFESTIHLWNEINSFNFDIVWAAEFRKLYSKEFIEKIKSTGKKLYAVSPDIHKDPRILHKRAYKGYELTWDDLIKWKADGICTDLPFQFRDFEKNKNETT